MTASSRKSCEGHSILLSLIYIVGEVGPEESKGVITPFPRKIESPLAKGFGFEALMKKYSIEPRKTDHSRNLRSHRERGTKRQKRNLRHASKEEGRF